MGTGSMRAIVMEAAETAPALRWAGAGGHKGRKPCSFMASEQVSWAVLRPVETCSRECRAPTAPSR